MTKIHVVSSEEGDWMSVYVDGYLSVSNHSITLAQFLRDFGDSLGIDFSQEEKSEDWFDEDRTRYEPD